MKSRRPLVFLLALLLVAAGWVGAVAPVLAMHHCRPAQASIPSAPCFGDCASVSDCIQVCAPLFIASASPGYAVHVRQPAPVAVAVTAQRWIALPQTRPPIA